MRKAAIIYCILFSIPTCGLYAQTSFPAFLQGVWKVEGEERYERWDLLQAQQLKGFSYTLQEGQMEVSEYLDLREEKGSIFYTASVLNQNEGRGVEFILQQEGNTYSFENRTHDFPKQIIYRKISDSEVKVEITNGKRGFGYLMRKTGAGKRRPDTISANPRYDKELAEKLGGDDYGMKGYYLIMLRTGTNDTADKEFISQCFRGHFENMEAMERNGKLVVAGPMGKNEQQYRGIFIINAVSETEARTLIQNDAAIKNNLLQAEIYPWYGSAALPAYLDAADKIWKRKP